MRKEKIASEEPIFEPMTQEYLNTRIDQSESDFQNSRFKNSSELLSKYKHWHWKLFGLNSLKFNLTKFRNITRRKLAQELLQNFWKGIINEPKKFIKTPHVGKEEELLKQKDFEYRYLVFKNYKLIYSVDAENGFIKIADVFDTRQNPPKLKRIKLKPVAKPCIKNW